MPAGVQEPCVGRTLLSDAFDFDVELKTQSDATRCNTGKRTPKPTSKASDKSVRPTHELLLRWRLRRHYRLRHVRPGGDEGNGRYVRHFSAFSVGQHDSRVVQQQSGRAIQFNLSLLIRRHGRYQNGFG